MIDCDVTSIQTVGVEPFGACLNPGCYYGGFEGRRKSSSVSSLRTSSKEAELLKNAWQWIKMRKCTTGLVSVVAQLELTSLEAPPGPKWNLCAALMALPSAVM